jgi:hypothetical protein
MDALRQWSEGVDPPTTELLAALLTILACGYIAWYLYDTINRWSNGE